MNELAIDRPRFTFEHLKDEVRQLQHARGGLRDDAAFVLWFLHTLTDQGEPAREALTGRTGEKGIDALLIDDRARQVHVIQGKFHSRLGTNDEKRNDVIGLVDIGLLLWADAKDVAGFLNKLEPVARTRFEAATRLVKRSHYEVKLHFVTTGRCSRAIANEAIDRCNQAPGRLEVEIVDGPRVMSVFKDYMEGVAPAVPSLTLPIANDGSGVRSEGVVHRFDPETEVESWVFSLPTVDAGEMYQTASIRLFARNIRGYQGESNAINSSMARTIKSEPQNFWYFNNGITIVCDHAKREVQGGRDVIRIDRPQVINGQQTTRTLSAHSSKRASVLTRVIRIPRSADDEDRYDDLVSQIVRATNWQTPIKPSDLVSNDYIQVFIERELRKRGYQYIRKRMAKGEARAQFGGDAYWQIKKDEMAQAVAGCELDPSIVRSGKEGLFDSRYYRTVFGTRDIPFYLSRYWLMVRVKQAARGRPSRAYAMWLVLRHTWALLEPTIGRGEGAARWIHSCEFNGYDSQATQIDRGIDSVFKGALAFYRRNKGRGEEAKDPSTFFQRVNLPGQFGVFWRRHGGAHRAAASRSFRNFARLLREVDLAE